MQYSKNFGMKLPERTDNVNVSEVSQNFELIDGKLAEGGGQAVAAVSSDGVTYTAEVSGLSELSAGISLTIIPNMQSKQKTVYLSVAGSSAKILLKGSGNTGSTAEPTADDWLTAGKPVTVQYNGTEWVADLQEVAASFLTGTVPIIHGGHGGTTAAEARANLGITPANIGAQPTITGAGTTVTSSNLTGSRALVSNASGKIAVSPVTATELGYLDGVTSNVQTQLNGKSAAGHTHSASDISSGTLPVTRGGTGVTSNPSMLINLGSTGAASVFAASPRPGVTGTLPVANGGTGSTTIPGAQDALGLSYVTTAGTGAAYTATIPGITELKKGVVARIIPHTANTASHPTLNVNGLGAFEIVRRSSNGTNILVHIMSASFLNAVPMELVFSGSYWILTSCEKPYADDLQNVSTFITNNKVSKFVCGSYSGAGTSKTVSLTIGFEPKCVFIYGDADSAGEYGLFIKGSSSSETLRMFRLLSSSASCGTGTAMWGSTTFEWDGSTSTMTLNDSGSPYKWAAWG